MQNIFDTSDTENRVEKLLYLISEYDQPFKIKQLRKFYNRKFPDKQIDANTASSSVHYLYQTKKIQKIERGLYAPLDYKK
jgi:hypothetical protein